MFKTSAVYNTVSQYRPTVKQHDKDGSVALRKN